MFKNMVSINMLITFFLTALTLKIYALPVEPVFYDDENFYVVNVPAEQDDNIQYNIEEISASHHSQEQEKKVMGHTAERIKRSTNQDSVIEVLSMNNNIHPKDLLIVTEVLSEESDNTSRRTEHEFENTRLTGLEAGHQDIEVSESRVFRPLFAYRKTLLKKSS